MKRFYSYLLLLAVMLTASVSANAAVNITKVQGWFESGCVIWTPADNVTYAVYVRPEGGEYTQLDKELLRSYGSYMRADMVGLKAGSYQFKVVGSNGDSQETEVFCVKAHDRSGFAHYGRTEGVGAYNNDGTLKDNARVLYVAANNAKTVSLDMTVDSKGKVETRTGLQNIIQAYEKGQEKRPLAVRIIGCVKKADMDEFGSSAEGLQVKGNGSSKCIANLTIEGIGDDATIHGFGILCRSISSVEFRNFAVMICLDDCLSLDTDNKNIWVHNMDFFYGGTGSAADQAKGDGTVDIKGKSSHVTVSYNHFYDSGKCSLGGMKSETTDCWMTYHHNWFDHSDSRHPRIRTAFYHVYNNYFDGNAKYGVGVTCGGSSFVESNYFRNCKYPMLISKQGTDAEGDGTFSGETGGVIKAYNNFVKNPRQVLYYDGKQTDGKWDAVKVSARDEAVNATAFYGGTAYNATATEQAILAVPADVIDNAEAIPGIVRGDHGAGRMNHGDFEWKFLNSVQDVNYAVITDMKAALLAYQSSLVGFADGTAIMNGGATAYYKGGDGQGISQEENDAYVPEWAAGGDADDDNDYEEEAYIANADGTDFYWVGDNNIAHTEQLIASGVITLGASKAVGDDGNPLASTFNKTYAGTVGYPSEHTGSLQLAKSTVSGTYDGGTATFYCPNGVTTFKLNTLRTGNTYYIVEKSTDGQNFTKVAEVNKGASGIMTKDFSTAVRNLTSTDPMWVRVTNGSSGGLNIFGVLINQLVSDDTREASDLTALTTEKSLDAGTEYTLVKGTDYTTSSTGDITFSSSNSKVATVDASGKIVAVAEGTATITIAQAKDDTYKAGSANVSVTVVDPRQASAFALTSDADVLVKEGMTSEIVTTGAAGAVTYSSSKSSVATVSADGIISGVAPGTAVITVTDAGTSSVKGATLTVNVTVTKDMEGVVVVTFSKPASGKTPVSSDETLVSFGGTTNYKDAAYGEYAYGVKLESSTEIYITPSANCNVTLVFDVAAKRSYLNGENITSDENGEYKFSAVGGTKYTLKKRDSVNLYAVIFDFTTTGIANVEASHLNNQMYDLQGRRIAAPVNGQMYIMNGKKFIQK